MYYFKLNKSTFFLHQIKKLSPFLRFLNLKNIIFIIATCENKCKNNMKQQ